MIERALYLDLLKKCVGNAIYDDDLDLMQGQFRQDSETGQYASANPKPADTQKKFYGSVWPSRAHTMIGIPRLDNIQQCVEDVIQHDIEGDLIETGVWRGGACIFMRGILKAWRQTDRQLWVADSFEGLPIVDMARYPQEIDFNLDKFADLAVSLQEVRTNFERYDLLDEQVHFLKGWFKDTLPTAPIEKLAVMRLDGDMYESTMDALTNLYHKLSVGGYVIIDDYNAVESCNLAITDFRAQNGITAELQLIPGAGAYWRK